MALLLPSWIWILCSNDESFAKNHSPLTLPVRYPKSPCSSYATGQDATQSVKRLRCHSSTGQIVPFPNGTGHNRASSILGLQCSKLELLVMPSSLAPRSSQKLASDESWNLYSITRWAFFSYFQAMAIEESPAYERHKMYCDSGLKQTAPPASEPPPTC